MESFKPSEKQKTLTKEYVENHKEQINGHDYINLFGNAPKLVIPVLVYVFEESGINIYHYIDYIPAYAYADRIDIIDMHIPPHIKDIQYAAFADCKTLTEVHVPKGVERIEDSAFHGIQDLKISFDGGRDEFDKIVIESTAIPKGTKIVCYDNSFLYGI